MNIALVGGGTGGPVAPLLAVAQVLRNLHPKAGILFVGTKSGPERRMAKQVELEFISINAGKLRRYFSFKNLITPFLLIVGFIQSMYIIKAKKIDCIFGAGGYVQVPFIWAGWLLGVPSVIHQQDVTSSLANTLCQFPAKKITVTFEASAKHFLSGIGLFYHKTNTEKTEVTGNPVRPDLLSANRQEALKYFQLSSDMPVLYVVGGGTGSLFINKLVSDALPRLKKAVQIIHSRGSAGRSKDKLASQSNYRAFDFIDRVDLAYAAADIVFCRAGLSTISELSLLKKTAVVVPLPGTHQELNAYFLDRNQAALVLPQEHLSADAFIYVIRKLLFKYEMQKTMQENISRIMPHNAAEKIAALVAALARKHHG